MKYFVRDWDNNSIKSKEIMQKYSDYYKNIEKHISINIKNALYNRHDTHIFKTYFQEKDYVMELEEKIWGNAYIIFKNANIKKDINIKDEYWLYDEIYKVKEKYKIHILFNKSEIIIECDDIYIKVKDKDYFKNLYLKGFYNIDISNNDKKNITNVVKDKEFICGYSMLNTWEKLIYSFIQIYMHIQYYKYNNIEEKLENYYYNLSIEEKKSTYQTLFSELEEKLIRSVKILEQHKEKINKKDLNNIINKFFRIFNEKHITIERKNQLYLKLGEEIVVDFNNLYRIILQYINENII